MRTLLDNAEKILCSLIFLTMTFLGFANIVVRYLSNHSLAVTEELLVNGFLLLTIFGAAIAARRGEHLAVTVIFDCLPKRGKLALMWIAGALSVLLLTLSAWYSLELVFNQIKSGTVSYGLQLPAWYYSVGLPFGFAIVVVRYLQHAAETYRGLNDPVTEFRHESEALEAPHV
ncbi:TRAP transporter small permease [Microvirga makkahensis]|uniref:TRAP transporter small permease protein n=1 Tax=Microvirga makkahensis TaxID=1128670 RepID=A0A7X3SPC3_9HYPH|nr:TRAP transporter small permease [Microvirga makkahensis]MXQ12125.1 TRAP transporter small permease subunit [Microvirga makkahensis]